MHFKSIYLLYGHTPLASVMQHKQSTLLWFVSHDYKMPKN
jgi:hypothetical protein